MVTESRGEMPVRDVDKRGSATNRTLAMGGSLLYLAMDRGLSFDEIFILVQSRASIRSIRGTAGFKEDAQVWIAKSTGMPWREEQDLDMGGEIGKVHNSARFEYSNVKPSM